MPLTIQEIKDHPIYGNHYQDHELWKQLDKIILDETLPIPHRVAASNKVYAITGEDLPLLISEDQVIQHAKLLREAR